MGYSADFFIAHFGGNVRRTGVTYWRSPPVKSSKSNTKNPNYHEDFQRVNFVTVYQLKSLTIWHRSSNTLTPNKFLEIVSSQQKNILQDSILAKSCPIEQSIVQLEPIMGKTIGNARLLLVLRLL